MRRGVLIAGALAMIAVLFWQATRSPSSGGVARSVELAPPAAVFQPRQRPRWEPPSAVRPLETRPEAKAPAPPSVPTARIQDPAAPARLKLLESVLEAGDDNDPRLDRDFDDLSDADKRLFRKKYREVPAERRNARGTIVYLLGRNLKSPEDWAFLRAVASEAPCLSLADCSKAAKDGDDHRSLGAEVSLAYPALVALKQAEWALQKDPREAWSVIRAAKESQIPAVAKAAAELERRR